MESMALIMAPMMISNMMYTAAPLALMMNAGDVDSEMLARGGAQLAIMGARSFMDVTYDDILLDEKSGDFSLRGLEITLPDAAGVPGCTVTVAALTVVSMKRPDALSFASEADGIDVSPACAAQQAPMILAMLGQDAFKADHYSATTIYNLKDSSLDHAMIFETAAAGSVSANARLEGLHLQLDEYGDPMPRGEITSLELTVQNTDALRELMPVLGLPGDPTAMVGGLLGDALSADGISDEEQALIDSAQSQIGRVLKDGGGLTLRSGPGASVSFAELEDTSGPEDLVPLLNPIFTAALPGADNLIPSTLLASALKTDSDLGAAERMRVAEALATGNGAPRSMAKAMEIYRVLADDGDATAMLRYAELLADNLGDNNTAYTYALRAGAAGAGEARSVLDRIERSLALTEVLGIQTDTAGEMPAPTADIASLRDAARGYANGSGTARHYGQAMLFATLAAAGGDRSSALLLERLSSRFAGDEQAERWTALQAEQSEKALQLWSEGFGDGFAEQ
jgi:TPR repeat protein